MKHAFDGDVMRKSHGFTLIELLVVIAVIALLMGILVPALRRARELGQRAACANNLKTLAVANLAYANTYDGAYVPVVFKGIVDGKAEYIEWLRNTSFRSYLSLKSYETGDEETKLFDIPDEFICPSDRISRDKRNRLAGVLCSYGYNYTEWKPESGWMPPINEYAGHWTYKIRQAAEKLMFVDGIDWWVEWSAADYSGALDEHVDSSGDAWGWDKLGQANIFTYKDKGFHGPTIYRHNEGANVTFYDGHVKYMKKEEVFVIEDYKADPKRPGMWVVDLAFYREWHH